MTRKSFSRCFSGVVAAVVLSSAATAQANVLRVAALGNPIPGGSWFQDFYVYAPTSFTNLGVYVNGGAALLEGAPSMDFSAGGTPGWFQVIGPPSGAVWPVAASIGPSSNSVIWRAHFADPVSQPFSISLFAFSDIGSNIFSGARATWNGSSWTYSGLKSLQEWYDFQNAVASNPVPVPAGVVLAGLGLLCVVSVRIRAKAHIA